MTHTPHVNAKRLASILHTDEAVVARLVRIRALPKPDRDGYDLAKVAACRRRRPWLDRLDRPLSEREVREQVDARLSIPAGRGLTMGGRRYITPAELLVSLSA